MRFRADVSQFVHVLKFKVISVRLKDLGFQANFSKLQY